jgi:hypothetical protein
MPYRAQFFPAMTRAAQRARQVFSGKLVYGNFLLPLDDAALAAAIDDTSLLLFFGGGIPAADNENLTVPLLKQHYLNVIQFQGDVIAKYDKPMTFQIFAQSHRNYLRDGWVEDGFCTRSCEQRSLTTDFSVQALAYEAVLEAISEQTMFTVSGVEVLAYWYVDVILGKDAFPNTSQSFRDKPAESILYQWFARP